MARTPLLRALRHLAREHHAAEQLGVTPAELRRRRAAGPSRRDFLKGAAALGVLTPALRVLPAGAAPPSIAIVGAGISGLTAALALRDKGLAATVYEASSRIGGRMHSDVGHWDQGQVSEFCGELINSGHTTVLGLASRFNLEVDDLSAAEPAGSTETYWFLGSPYPAAQADLDFAPVREAAKKDLTDAGYPTLWNKYKAAGWALDHLSIHDWIAKRVPGGHASPFGRLLDTAYTIEYGAETKDQSSLNLIYLLAYQPSPKGFAAFGVSDERYHIRGGNQRLPKAIAATLPPRAARLAPCRHQAGQWRRDARLSDAERPREGRGRPGDPHAPVRRPPHPRLQECGVRRPEADCHQGARGRPQRQAAAPVQEPLLERERVQRLVLRRPRLPEHLGGEPRPARHVGHPGQLHGRRHGRGVRAVSALRPCRHRPQGGAPTPKRSWASSRPCSRGYRPSGPAAPRCPHPCRTPISAAPTPTGRSASTPPSPATRGCPRGRSILPASTARRTSRASWKAVPPKVRVRASRSGTRWVGRDKRRRAVARRLELVERCNAGRPGSPRGLWPAAAD